MHAVTTLIKPPLCKCGENSLPVLFNNFKITIMVTIIGHAKRKNSEDQDFNVLILQGDVEPVISGGTGKKIYLTHTYQYSTKPAKY